MAKTSSFIDIMKGFKAVTKKPHFEKVGYSVGKTLFATIDAEHTLGCVKLSLEAQKEFSKIDKAVYPVPNSWGKKGWTYLDLLTIRESLLAEVIETSYKETSKDLK